MRKILCIIIICALFIAPIFTITAIAAVPYGNMTALYNMEGALKDEVSGKDGTLMSGASFVAETPADAPVDAVTPAVVVSAPKTKDSMAIMLVLMGVSVIGSVIYAYMRKRRV